jgi:hypothetical protein
MLDRKQTQTVGPASTSCATARILAYGFDKIGFDQLPSVVEEPSRFAVEFAPYDSTVRLDSADGVIIPQGIFEEFKRHSDRYESWVSHGIDWPRLQERERQVVNILRDGKWACFLVRGIVDSYFANDGNTRGAVNTDLAKRELIRLGVSRRRYEATDVAAKDDAFASYIRHFGVAETQFDITARDTDHYRVLAASGGRTFGIEVDRSEFFLPFHTSTHTAENAESIVRLVACGILDYREKNTIPMPSWLGDLHFSEETAIAQDVRRLQDDLQAAEDRLARWTYYKATLTTSGRNLKSILVDVFREYFGFTVDPTDAGHEDFRVLDSADNVVAVVETKGTKKGIKREQVNQADSDRARSGLEASIPALLLVNNEMSVAGIEERLATAVPQEHVERAKMLNVTIVRTIDLVTYMQRVEAFDVAKRRDDLLKLIGSQVGWLEGRGHEKPR